MSTTKVAYDEQRGEWGAFTVYPNGKTTPIAAVGKHDYQAEAQQALDEWVAAQVAPRPTGQMTVDEAREITGKIGGYAKQLPVLLKEAHDRGAHTALGYESWAAYCTAEFDISKSQAYRLISFANFQEHLLTAAQVPAGVPIGDTPFGQLTEGGMRGVDRDQAIEAVGSAVAGLPDDATDDERDQAAADALADVRTPPPGVDPETGEISTDLPVDAGADDTAAGDSAPATDVDAAVPTPAASTTIDDGAEDHSREDQAHTPGVPSSSSAVPPAADLSRSEPHSSAGAPAGSPSPTARKKVQPHRDDATRTRIDRLIPELRWLADQNPEYLASICNPQDRDIHAALFDAVAAVLVSTADAMTPTHLRSVQ